MLGSVSMPGEAAAYQEDAARFLILLFLKKDLKIEVNVPFSQASLCQGW